MLHTLRIRNLVIVDDLSVEFGAGLNLLTGETGAGKSILIDALGLVAGGRADRSLVRQGADRAVVEALFEVEADSGVRGWAADHGVEIDEDGQILIQRELPASGSGRVLINGSPATVAVLRELGSRLVELHGQHEQFSLLGPDTQLELLDTHGGLSARVESVRVAYDEVRAAERAVESLGRQAADREERIARLSETVREIDELAPRPGELAEIERDCRVLRNAGRVSDLLEAIVALTYEGEPSAASLAGTAADRAEELGAIDASLGEVAARIRSASVDLHDAGDELRDYRDRGAFDPARLDELETRRAAIDRLCLRHAADEAELVKKLERSRAELRTLDALDAEIDSAAAAHAAAIGRYIAAARGLGKARRAAARKLERAVVEQLAALAMPAARFEIVWHPARGSAVGPADGETLPLGPRGAERVEFQLAANTGEAPSALAQAASGGELSRVMLALHVVADDAADRRALVFDEVDSGVGGAVADAVGARLARLARRQQALCVTHLPQVAAYADRHFLVHKGVSAGRTLARVATLSTETRVEELARMLGGKKPTATSRRHAAELLSAAARPRSAPRREA